MDQDNRPLKDERPKVERLLPPNFVHCSRKDLIVISSRMLNSLIRINDKLNGEDVLSSLTASELTRFHSRTPPGISVFSYLTRLARYSSLENAVILATVYYIDLLSNVYPAFTLNSLTVHRFLLTATTVGSKGLCDSFCTNPHYAKVGGIHPTELEILEREFLTKIRYRVLPRELNVERCVREGRDNRPKERKNSLGALGANQGTHKTDAESANEEELLADDYALGNVHLRPNAGFNLLNRLYQNMVDVVGQTPASDEETEFYIYSIDQDYETDEGGRLPMLVNPDPDTMSDDMFRQGVQEFFTQLRSINHETQHKQQEGLTRQQNSSSSANADQRTQNSFQQSMQQLNIQRQPHHQTTSSGPLKQTINSTVDGGRTTERHARFDDNQSPTSVASTPRQLANPHLQQVMGESIPSGNSGQTGGRNVIKFPASPLKRPIEHDTDSFEPAGKRTPSAGALS
ncbi:CYFA0S17e01596g1_1 [Cyberlindnera fabianii]|uniref:CYFA0S17e01596g1_1 n=1 Tax=Cyberlindnera fabianii TaxID=36022 RepID=A0A061B657_CYBFA|nr:CYFA0S17e01596g1_1 [Cyberlindnera fabianii]